MVCGGSWAWLQQTGIMNRIIHAIRERSLNISILFNAKDKEQDFYYEVKLFNSPFRWSKTLAVHRIFLRKRRERITIIKKVQGTYFGYLL
jgi:hypothetical protein